MKNDVKHKNTDFFDYTAELGENKINQLDVEAIFSRIDKRTGASASSSLQNKFISFLIIAFTLFLLVVLFNKTSIIQIGQKTKVIEGLPKNDIITKANHIDTVVKEIITSKTLSHTMIPEIEQQHFMQKNSNQHFSNEIQFEDLPLKQAIIKDTIQTKASTDNYLELLPNAPYIYIYDLKITEYQTLYFKNQQSYTIERNGLDAEYENVNTYLQSKKEMTSLLPYTLDLLVKDALKYFNNGQYKKAAILFKELLMYNANDVNALFYSGLCNYYLENPSITVEKMNALLINKNNVFHQEAEWYMALAYLKLGENEQAISLLLKINTKKGFYAKSAADKLFELKK